jgi:hypothetical protein
MGPNWYRRWDHGRFSCSGSWPTTLTQPGTSTATDTVAAEAAEGIAALERMLADEAALAIA